MVKQGYKQTEIGVIPEDWEVVDFLDEFVFLSTASYSRAEILEQGTIGYIHYGDIHTKLHFHLDLDKYVSGYLKKEQVKTYSKIEIGDLIMADASEDYEGVGKAVEVIRKNSDFNVISGLHTFLIRAKNINRFALGFKGYFQNNVLIKKQYDALATGLKVYSLSKNSFKNIQIPLPPLPEQEAIATALSDADAWIESLEQLIAKKRLIKQGAMQELLTPKDNWEVKKLGDVCIEGGLIRGPFGGALKKEFFVKSGYKVYEQKNAIYKSVKLGNYYIDHNKFKELSRFEIKKDDFILSCSGTIGKIYRIPLIFEKGVINQALLIIRLNKEVVSHSYFNHVFQFDTIQSKIIDDTQGGAMKNLVGMSEFRNTEIPLPTLSEQTRIATILSDMDAEIEALEQKLSKARQIKQGMMQELLTGRVRLV